MSCLPCFGKKKDGNAEGGGGEQAGAGPMTPPPAVHAPASYHGPAAAAPVSVAAPASVTPTKPPGESDANPEDALRQAIEVKAFAFRELAAATDHFTPYNLVGEGGFFRVYKGQLEKEGQAVAIKQMDKHGFQGNIEFLTEVSKLSKLHHENLIDIIGYCADGDQRLLVYEHMDGGTLEDHLYDLPPEKKPMDWMTRMKVANGAAQGLEYLHEKADPPVVYGDFKASQVLLDSSFTPKLSDFGLQQLGQSGGGNMPMASPMMGAFGCLAPEYDRGGQVSMKSDVYSFGVVLLQLISGRRTVDTSKPVEEQNVVTWAQPKFKDQKKYHELVDPLIKREYPAKALNQVVAMASMCLQEEDCVRPMMGDVVMTLGFLMMLPPDPPAPEPEPAPAPAPAPEPVPEPAPKKDDESRRSGSSSSSSDDDGGEEEEEEEEEEQS
ncbi:probable serine/threonine-protein kinase PBL23 [Triticum urartu]|uniref:Protein kinase domain-containing protein n=1 Tax=Triticum urartu TaxID=4572 RepID=A0A8R7P5V2_TRIUA|nr:probable serine/threonine-protein kinase PBL23 [Triticum urartu]